MIEKEKNHLKDLIYIIKKKLIKQLNILMMKWMNMLKNFIKQRKRKKKTMAYHFKLIVFFITKMRIVILIILLENSYLNY